MKRLVYSPSVNVWIKTDTGVFDLSPYVTETQIDRRVGEVSFAKVSFRNPRVTDERNPKKTKFMFTEHLADDGTIRPMFHPMDPIIITMTRLKGRPIQVFTGYCDTTPYVQLLPGVVTIDASCTLKRLQHTYWDPALLFVRDFMQANGWGIDESGTALSPKSEKTKGNLNDSSLGGLLFNIVKEVGGWDPKNIFIEALPGQQVSSLVSKLYADNAKESKAAGKQLGDFMSSIIGASAYGEAGSGGSSSGSEFSGSVTLFGDSITVAAHKKIEDKIPGITIYAQGSKPLGSTPNGAAGTDDGEGEVIGGDGVAKTSGLKLIKAHKNDLGDNVVIALGTNDENSTNFKDKIDKAMDLIGNTKKVVLLTINKPSDDKINAAIKNAATRYSNITIGDWKEKSKSSGVLDQDQIHPTNPKGTKAFAQVIADALGIPDAGTGSEGWVRVGATTFDDQDAGASGRLGQLGANQYDFAELGTAVDKAHGAGLTPGNVGNLGRALGTANDKELPMFTKLQIRYKGKVITATKTDRGYGQGGNGIFSDPTYAIDLWTNAAQALNFSGKDFVEVKRVS